MEPQSKEIVEVRTEMVLCFVMSLEVPFAHAVISSNPVFYPITMAD